MMPADNRRPAEVATAMLVAAPTSVAERWRTRLMVSIYLYLATLREAGVDAFGHRADLPNMDDDQ